MKNERGRGKDEEIGRKDVCPLKDATSRRKLTLARRVHG